MWLPNPEEGEAQDRACVPVTHRISSIQFLRTNRVKLIDDLDTVIDWLLDETLQKQLVSKDEYEDVKYTTGPRKKVRAMLDVIELHGEEVAALFCSLLPSDKSRDIQKRQTTPHEIWPAVKQKHKQVLSRRSEKVVHYNTRPGEKTHLTDQFINLLLIEGHYNLELKKHELLTFGKQRIYLQEKSTGRMAIEPNQLFMVIDDRRAPSKILVSGIAGIGKTFLLQKIVYDWANNQIFENFEFLIHFTFRDLNLISKPMSFRNVILKKNGHLSTVLDFVFENPEKLLVILDGFDEFRFYDGLGGDCYISDPDEESDLPVIINSLLRGELLFETSIILTTRPTAISHIPVEIIDRFIVITGFSEREIKNFFLKYYQNDEFGSRMFELIRENDFLFTLCFVPAFCYIVCSVLKEKEGLGEKQPRTMSDIYVRYLTALLRHHARPLLAERGHLTVSLRNVGRMAYRKLLEHQTLFYESDLEVFHVDLKGYISSFLDQTCVQEPESVEGVFSFTHFTMQEFLAALYYVLEPNPSPDIMNPDVKQAYKLGSGYLDIFVRFLSGLLSDRNQTLLSKYILLDEETKSVSYLCWLLAEITEHCENGSNILNLLHCLFEQQNHSLAEKITPKSLHINVSDNALGPIDFNVLKYFLDMKSGGIVELDVTATNINGAALRSLQPYMQLCENLWCGDNKLDSEAIQTVCELLESANLRHLGLGWTNIGNNELRELQKALIDNKTLLQLWIEGNNIDYEGVSGFSADLTNNSTLNKVVLIGNKLEEEDIEKLHQRLPNSSFLITGFSNDCLWEGWCDWILQRCQVCDNETLAYFLIKIFHGISQHQSFKWMPKWCEGLRVLLKDRIGNCRRKDIKKKLEKLEHTISLHC